MKVSRNEGVASHVGPESCVDDRKVGGEALTGEVRAGLLSHENLILQSADAVMSCGRQQQTFRQREGRLHSGWSKIPCTHRRASQGGTTPPYGIREIPRPACHRAGPRTEPARGTSAMHDHGKSDGFIVPAKSPNKAVGAPTVAEGMEGRNPAKGNLAKAKRVRTQRRFHPSTEPRRVRRADTRSRVISRGKSPVR